MDIRVLVDSRFLWDEAPVTAVMLRDKTKCTLCSIRWFYVTDSRAPVSTDSVSAVHRSQKIGKLKQ
jgi:hypothetical protein